MSELEQTLLGKQTAYPDQYDPDLLYPLSRQAARARAGLIKSESDALLPFHGTDIWNGYELTWLNTNGVPQVAIAEFTIPYHSPYLIESKSFKLYLNAFHQTTFNAWSDLQAQLEKDLSSVAQAKVGVRLLSVNDYAKINFATLPGSCIDDNNVSIDCYQLHPDYLSSGEETVSEMLHSHLLKSNCPVTGQPDFASVLISYHGRKIDHTGLLKYIVSYRRHEDFHEQCVERIFCDILTRCQPETLSVYARYTRRGGLDINPFRSNVETVPDNRRLWRQ